MTGITRKGNRESPSRWATPMKVFLFEWVTGGGFSGSDIPASWAAEGRAMRIAAAETFLAVAGVEVVVALDARFDAEPANGETARLDGGTESLVETAKACDVTLLIAPETDGVLADLVRTFESEGLPTLNSSPEAI